MRSFCNAKASLIFLTKNFSVFGFKVVKHEHVKLRIPGPVVLFMLI